jgi:hypothetical protein
MTDVPWYARGHAKTIAPRDAMLGELLWTLGKGTHTQTAVLRTHAGGVELQFSRNGQWYYGRRHNLRVFALDDAATVRRDLEQDGWTEPVTDRTLPASSWTFGH